MELKKKLTDFLSVEDGSIARKSMMLTGAVLATSVVGGVVTAAEGDGCGCSTECKCGCYNFEGYYEYLDCPHSNSG